MYLRSPEDRHAEEGRYGAGVLDRIAFRRIHCDVVGYEGGSC